jgi:glycosyltransferase involved in cell wall biosynthesis
MKKLQSEVLTNVRVVFVIPAFNEEAVIFSTIQPIVTAGHAVVCVDDASIDATSEMASKAGATVVRHLINAGQGASLQTGFDFITQRANLFKGSEFVVTFDADGQHSLDDLDRFLEAFRVHSDLDIVLGSRFLSLAFKGSRSKYFLLKTMAFISRFTLGVKLTDRHNGFRVIKKDKVHFFQLKSAGYEHADEFIHIISKNQLKYSEVATDINYTEYSIAKGQPIINGFKILFDRLISGWK